MPARFKEYGVQWRRLNPEWHVQDWSWSDLPDDLANDRVLEDIRGRCTSGLSLEMPTALADVISYDLVERFGGIYANADIQPVKSLEVLRLDEYDIAWATYEENNYPLVVNALFGASEEHDPFWTRVVGQLEENYFSMNVPGQPGVEMVFSSGPRYLTAVSEQGGIPFRVLPYYTVNPFLWKDIPQGSDASELMVATKLPEGCVGVHHWAHRKNGRSNVVS